jgi:hypothetical protein
VLEAREPDGRGGPARPLPSSAIVEKFRDNARRALAASQLEELEEAVLRIDGAPAVGKVLALCRG